MTMMTMPQNAGNVPTRAIVSDISRATTLSWLNQEGTASVISATGSRRISKPRWKNSLLVRAVGVDSSYGSSSSLLLSTGVPP